MKDSFPKLDDRPQEAIYRANCIILEQYSNHSFEVARDYVASIDDAAERSKAATTIFSEVSKQDAHDRTGRALNRFFSAFPEQQQNILASALNDFKGGRNAEHMIKDKIVTTLNRQEREGGDVDLSPLIQSLTPNGHKLFISSVNDVLRENQETDRLSDVAAHALSSIISHGKIAPKADVLQLG